MPICQHYPLLWISQLQNAFQALGRSYTVTIHADMAEEHDCIVFFYLIQDRPLNLTRHIILPPAGPDRSASAWLSHGQPLLHRWLLRARRLRILLQSD